MEPTTQAVDGMNAFLQGYENGKRLTDKRGVIEHTMYELRNAIENRWPGSPSDLAIAYCKGFIDGWWYGQ